MLLAQGIITVIIITGHISSCTNCAMDMNELRCVTTFLSDQTYILLLVDNRNR